MGFSRQGYWSQLPRPLPEDPPESGIEPMSPRSPALAGELFTTSATWEAPVATEDATGSKISQEASGEVTLNWEMMKRRSPEKEE